MASDADALALPQTILSGLGLLAVLLAIIALGVERIRRVREYDKGHDTTKSNLVGCFSNKPVSALWSLMGRHSRPLIIPNIGGLIEAADKGQWTSTTLDHMLEIHPELTWVPLYESIFDDLLNTYSDMPDSWGVNSSVARIFNRLQGSSHRQHVSELAKARRDLLHQGYLANGIRKLPGVGTSTKDDRKGLARVTTAWLVGKKPCVPVTREELVALSLVMGMSIRQSNGDHYSGIGAYGLSIDLSHTEGNWKLSLAKGSRIPRHAPSMGSGYTSLMAKHLACGSIPFDEHVDWVRSVYVTDAVLAAIKNGICVKDIQAYGGPSLEFLRRLPGYKPVDAYYGIAEEHESHNWGAVLNNEALEVGRWARLIAGIAFGGLVPQVHRNVIEAVRFTVAGKIEGCVQNLEALVDTLYHLNNRINIFGDRVAERASAEGNVYLNHTYPSSDKNPRDAASTFARYMNLLEHVVARCDVSLSPNGDGAAAESNPNGLATTQPSTIPQNQDLESGLPLRDLGTREASKDNGPTASLLTNSEEPSQPSDLVFKSTVELLERVYEAAVKARKIKVEGEKWWQLAPEQRTSLSKEEQDLVEQDLGDALKSIRDALKRGERLSLESASTIVRCILAAWADTVPQIEVMEHVPTQGEPSRSESGTGAISMDALPSVMALG